MEFDSQYYKTQYRDYRRQNPPRKLAHYRRLLETALDRVERPRVLDLGCAFGLFLRSLNPLWDCTGIDVSEHAIRSAAPASPGIRFLTMLPGQYPDLGLFDGITAFDVLEHIPQLDEVLDWIRGSLTPGGVLLAVVPVYDGPTGPVVRWLDRDPTHVHRISRAAWLSSLRARFPALDWHGIFRYLLPGGYYVHVPTRRLRRFAPAIGCIGRGGS